MKKSQRNQAQEEIYALWSARPLGQRRSADTLQFIDEMWATGRRLASSQANHYQHVMDVIRVKIED